MVNKGFIVGEVKNYVSYARRPVAPHAMTQVSSEFGMLAGLVGRLVGSYAANRGPRLSRTAHRFILNANEHKLLLEDYIPIADKKGRLKKKGEYALSGANLRTYKAEAQLVYATNDLAIRPENIDEWKELRQGFEYVRNQECEGLPSLHVMPHVGALMLNLMDYVAPKDQDNYWLQRSVQGFRKEMQVLLSHGSVASDAIAEQLVTLSADLEHAEAPLIERFGREAPGLDQRLSNTGRAVSRICAIPYLMAADRGSPEDAALCTYASRIAWHMMRMGDTKYSDPNLQDQTELLGEQWRFGLVADSAVLSNPTLRGYCIDYLTAQAKPA